MAFSPSAEMGLTDIEMAHNLDLDDCLFDDRQYEMVYEVCPPGEWYLSRNTVLVVDIFIKDHLFTWQFTYSIVAH